MYLCCYCGRLSGQETHLRIGEILRLSSPGEMTNNNDKRPRKRTGVIYLFAMGRGAIEKVGEI